MKLSLKLSTMPTNLLPEQVEKFDNLLVSQLNHLIDLKAFYRSVKRKNLTDKKLAQRELILLATSPNVDIAIFKIDGLFFVFDCHKKINKCLITNWYKTPDQVKAFFKDWPSVFTFFTNDSEYLLIENYN